MLGLFLAPATDRNGAYGHFRKTVLNGVPRALYSEYTDKRLNSVGYIWGLSSSTKSTWEGVNIGDWVLFYTHSNKYEYAARVKKKEHNPKLGDVIREQVLEDVSDDRDWDLLLFLEEPISVSITGDEISEMFDYGNNYPVRFMRVTEDRMESLDDEYKNTEGLINAIRS